jgi:hypothetical protein
VIGNYLVSLKGISGIPITVTVFIPKIPGRYFGEPERCFPSEPEELEWIANTGHELLNLLTQEDYIEEVETQLHKQFLERIND